MSKILIAILTMIAFFYALWLVLSGRKLPNPARARGLHRRFIFATLLFAGLLAGLAKAKQPERSIMCYQLILDTSNELDKSLINRAQVVATLQAVWLTLDKERGDEFRAQHAYIGEGDFNLDPCGSIL